MELPRSLFERFISRPRSLWPALVVLVLLPAGLMAAAGAEGSLADFFANRRSPILFVPPAVIAYVLLIAPRLARMEAIVVGSFRPIVLLDDDSYRRAVRQATRIQPHHELLAIGAGLVVGLLVSTSSVEPGFSWLSLVWIVSEMLMFGLLAWTVHVSVAASRLSRVLLRQPLRVDPLDIGPFLAVGRQSLLLALVFVGGISQSLVFTLFDEAQVLQIRFWLPYLPLASVPIMVFFLNMCPTHRVLSTSRARELEAVRRQLRSSSHLLLQRLAQKEETGSLPSETCALATYEERLPAANTWPYNMAMLRTLGVAVFLPGVTVSARRLVEVLLK